MNTKTQYYYLGRGNEGAKELGFMVAAVNVPSYVTRIWAVRHDKPLTRWTCLVEALAAGANSADIERLACDWNCTDETAMEYAEWEGMKLCLTGSISQWVASKDARHATGDTRLEAMANLKKYLMEVNKTGTKSKTKNQYVACLMDSEVFRPSAILIEGDNEDKALAQAVLEGRTHYAPEIRVFPLVGAIGE